VPFSAVLLGLNIPKLGWVLAQSLARHFGNCRQLLAASQEEVEEVDGFGPTAPRSSSSGSRTSRTARSSRSCDRLGLRFELGEEDKPKEGPLDRQDRT
jgi:NAD-dependent DNA ligase